MHLVRCRPERVGQTLRKTSRMFEQTGGLQLQSNTYELELRWYATPTGMRKSCHGGCMRGVTFIRSTHR